MRTRSSTVRTSSREAEHCGEVFIVDDDEYFRDILASIVELEGFPVTAFENGEAFLEKATEKTPVCVFLDVVMPGRSGLQILKELQARKYGAPIFLTSSRDDTPTVVDALKSGGHDFLRKPFDPYAAVLRVREAVEMWGRREKERDASNCELGKYPASMGLSTREVAEVMAHIVRGVPSRTIGRTLGLDPRDVDTFRLKIIDKLGAKSATDFLRTALR